MRDRLAAQAAWRRSPAHRRPPRRCPVPGPLGHILYPLVLTVLGLVILIQGGAFGL